MRGSGLRIFPSSLTGIARRVIFAVLLLAIVAKPAAPELCAKERKRVRAAREQKQADADKDQTLVKEQAKDKEQPKETAQAKEAEQSKDTVQNKDQANDKDAVADKNKGQETGKAKENDKPEVADKPKAGDKGPPEKGTDKATVARKVDERTRPAVSLTEARSAIAPVLDVARSSRDAIRKLPAYTCTFSKQEQLKKGVAIRQTMSLKFRREPFSVYLKFVDPNAGREVIYVEGRNNGKLQVHEASGLTSLIGTINLSPTGNEAMKENKYPLTMIGMEKMLERFIVDWEESQKHADTKVQLYPQAKLGEIECTMYEVTHPQQREPFKFHRNRVYFDKKTLLPIRAEQFAFPAKPGAEPQLVEEYTYTDVKVEAALSEADFDVKNEKYGFK